MTPEKIIAVLGDPAHGDVARAVLDVTGADALVLLIVEGNQISAHCRATGSANAAQLVRLAEVLRETAHQISTKLQS